jgi:hypothetical protein
MLRRADSHDVHSRLLERLGQIVVQLNVTEPGLRGAVTSFFDGLAANGHDLRVRIPLQGRDMLCGDPTGTMHKNAEGVGHCVSSSRVGTAVPPIAVQTVNQFEGPRRRRGPAGRNYLTFPTGLHGRIVRVPIYPRMRGKDGW